MARYLKRAQKQHFFFTFGMVCGVEGLLIKVEGLDVFIGELCKIQLTDQGKFDLTEVVGFVKKTVLLMPLGELSGIKPGCLVYPSGEPLTVEVSEQLLGHTLDGLGKIIDGSAIDHDDLVS